MASPARHAVRQALAAVAATINVPPIDVLVSRIGVAIATVAAMAGVRSWSISTPSRRYLTLFLCGTSLMGALQMGLNLWGASHPESRTLLEKTAWIGNLWTGFCALAYLGALVEAMPAQARRWFRVGQWGMILGWSAWCWANPDVFGPSFTPHIALNIVGMSFGGASLAFAVRALDLDAFWLSISALLTQSLDLVGYLALRGSLGLPDEQAWNIWAARNGMWCVAYAFFAYYLLQCPTPSRSRSFS